MVRSAFNQGSYQGIRSLPNALKPDFRRQLYEKILEHAKVARQTRQTRQPGEVQLEAAVRRAPRPTAQGQWRPGKFSSVPSLRRIGCGIAFATLPFALMRASRASDFSSCGIMGCTLRS